MALVSWEDICTPTRQGGLGVPHLDTLNMALLTKWVRRIVGPEDDMIKNILRDRYGFTSNWESHINQMNGVSAFWRGLGKVFPVVREFFRAQLGNGAGFRFWLDDWTSCGLLRELFPRLYALACPQQALVEDCWEGAWSPAFVANLSNQRVEDFIRLQQALGSWRPVEGTRDGWIWAFGPFSVRRVYRRMRTHCIEDPVILRACRSIWRQKIPSKVMVFAWTFARKRTLTRVRRKKIFPTELSLCLLCMEKEEDCEHLFFECWFARAIWASQGLSEITSSSTFWATMPRRQWVCEKDRGRRFAVLWAIWSHRNEVIFDGKTVSVDGAINDVERLVFCWFDPG